MVVVAFIIIALVTVDAIDVEAQTTDPFRRSELIAAGRKNVQYAAPPLR